MLCTGRTFAFRIPAQTKIAKIRYVWNVIDADSVFFLKDVFCDFDAELTGSKMIFLFACDFARMTTRAIVHIDK